MKAGAVRKTTAATRTLEPGKANLRFLRKFVGARLSLKILKALPEGRLLLQTGTQRFEAVLRGQPLSVGEKIEVEVRLLRNGGLELRVLPEQAASLVEIQQSLSLFPKALAQMLGAFLFASRQTNDSKKGRPSPKEALEKGRALREDYEWLKPLLKKSTLHEKSRLTSLLEALFRESVEGSKETADGLLPDFSFQEVWELHKDAFVEKWGFEAVGQVQNAPAYFFFELSAPSLGKTSGILLGQDVDFSKLHIFLRTERQELCTYLQNEAAAYRSFLHNAGIEIAEFRIFSDEIRPGLNLDA